MRSKQIAAPELTRVESAGTGFQAELRHSTAARPTVSDFLSEEAFRERLQGELRRTERSRRPFVLMLAEGMDRAFTEPGANASLLATFTTYTRGTDIRGWNQEKSVLGIVFTEADTLELQSVVRAIETRMRGLLAEKLTVIQLSEIRVKFLVFPDAHHLTGEPSEIEQLVEPDGPRPHHRRGLSVAAKRVIDIAGSLGALAVASPVFIALALIVKFTSKGPILFRQTRVGEDGRPFTFLKFRSMYAANDSAIHQEYVKNLIQGKETVGPNGEKVYKIVNDPRVTPVGRILRRTSLDEIPQFINVLKGDMSLVGPRPPIPYEVQHYKPWHRQRLSAKPGITGLWQVQGRSRTTFDEMVRLDVQYVRSWTVFMDLRILFQTPKAVLTGNGAH